MTILTTTEKFEFLSIELWCFMDRLKDVGDPLNLLQLAENLELYKCKRNKLKKLPFVP